MSRETERLYVLTRRDLGKNAKAQACHGAVQFVLDHPGTWENSTLIILGVENEAELAGWERLLAGTGLPVSRFTEPDLGGQLTAVACPARKGSMGGLRLL